MKVGLVCPYDLSRPGGVQAQVLGLAKALRDRGEDAQVIGPGLPEGEQGVDLGRTTTVPGNRSKVPISLDPRLSKVFQVIGADFDLLHVHEPLMPTASIAALRAGPPVVATFHADPPAVVRRLYRAAGRTVRRALGPNVKAVTAVSTTAASALPSSLGAVIVPNGVDTSAMRAEVERDQRLVVFLGRDEPRKGLGLLLDAWPTIAEAVPEAHLTAMGGDRGHPEVTWLGEVNDATKSEVLSSAAVLVAPNTGGESFGIVLIEGMAAGAAVVASDLAAFRDVGANAVRYFPVRDVSALADAVVEVLTDDRLRQALSSRGIERAKAFDWQVVADRYATVYSQALS